MEAPPARITPGGVPDMPLGSAFRNNSRRKKRARIPVEGALVTKSRCAHLGVSAQLPTDAGSLHPNWRRKDIEKI